jgi:iron complex outermembrane receptor protein
MFTNSKLAKSIRLAMAFGAASTAMVASNASAQEATADDSVEKIEVTGSRIKRTDMEGASPVTILTAADMAAAGRFTVADALRNSTANQFGSFNERSGSGAQSQATISLLGAGSNRTLVLLDGKRLPGSPSLGGTAVNLNQIPMSIVERIEINKDGGSAVYGSDAIAGVVNIVLKQDYEGFNVTGEIGRPSKEGADSTQFSFTGGISNDKGNVTFAFEHSQSDPIFDGDRDYTSAFATDLNGDGVIQAYTETDGNSLFGATIVAPDFSTTLAAADCDDRAANIPGFLGEVAADDDWGAAGATYCMFSYANVSANKASSKRNSLFVNANYEIAEDVEVFSRMMAMHNQSFGRYAPPAAWWRQIDRDNAVIPQEMRDLFPDAATFDGTFRWTGIGNRDNNVDDFTQDYILGLRGTFGDTAEWEVYAHYNLADNKSVGSFYLNNAAVVYNQERGIPFDSEEGINNLKTTTLNNDRNRFMQYYAGVGFEAGELSGGAIGHYFGAEVYDIVYSSEVDASSEAGLVGGSAGNSSGASRDVSSVFYESVMPVTDELEVNFAIRYDDYSDFGSEVSPKISLSYRPMDSLLVRASWGEGFRAPTLSELTQADSFSAEDSTDYVLCEATGISGADCPTRQIDTTVQSNSELGPETSEFLNIGVVYNITDDVSITVDYFDLEVDDVIQYVSVDDLILNEYVLNDQAIFDTTQYVNYTRASAGGRIIEAFTGTVNGPGFHIEGLDINLNASVETEVGEFGINWENSYFLAYEQEAFYNGPVQDVSGWGLQPDLRSQMTLSWSMGDHAVSWNIDYIASTYENEAPEFDSTGEATGLLTPSGSLDSFVTHNVSYSYDGGDYGQYTLGVRNLTEEEPVLDSAGTYPRDHYDLYTAGHIGRTVYANFSWDF